MLRSLCGLYFCPSRSSAQLTERRRLHDRYHNSPRIALAHDWLVSLRGGEHVLDRLARLFGPTTLYTLVSNGSSLTPAIDACDVQPSLLQHLPGASGPLRRWYFPIMPWAVGRIKVAPCDVLISTSSAVMKSIRPPRGVPQLCYCHSPARYIWEQTADYAIGSAGRSRQFGLRLMRHPFQRWDRKTASRVTRFLANSQHTASRIKRCYDRDASVVYPPVRTEFFTLEPSVAREQWMLVVSALEPYKRVDLVIDAARVSGRPLKIIGDGSQRQVLEAQATAGGCTLIEFLGRVSDEVMRDHYRRAAAFLFPQTEDFGITAVEAQAAGCPVVAYASGGALETVNESSGAFMHEQTVEALLQAIDQLPTNPSEACRSNAERFSEATFDAAITRHVQEILAEAQRG